MSTRRQLRLQSDRRADEFTTSGESDAPPATRLSHLLVGGDVPASLHGGVESAVSLLRLVLRLDFAEAQAELVYRHDAPVAAPRDLIRRHEHVAHREL